MLLFQSEHFENMHVNRQEANGNMMYNPDGNVNENGNYINQESAANQFLSNEVVYNSIGSVVNRPQSFLDQPNHGDYTIYPGNHKAPQAGYFIIKKYPNSIKDIQNAIVNPNPNNPNSGKNRFNTNLFVPLDYRKYQQNLPNRPNMPQNPYQHLGQLVNPYISNPGNLNNPNPDIFNNILGNPNLPNIPNNFGNPNIPNLPNTSNVDQFKPFNINIPTEKLLVQNGLHSYNINAVSKNGFI